MIRRGRWALAAVAILLACSSCRFQLDVDVVMNADGRGDLAVIARVDDEALARVGGDLNTVLDLDGLRADGWIVAGPSRGADGITEVQLHHPFATPEEAGRVFARLAGTDGPFQGFRLVRDRSFWRDRWTFRGKVDLSKGAGRPSAVGDAGLDQLGRQLSGALDRLIQVRVGVRLPGAVSSNATTKADNGAVWKVHLGDRPISLEADGSRTRTSSVVLVAAAALAGAVLVVTLLIRLAIRRTG